MAGLLATLQNIPCWPSYTLHSFYTDSSQKINSSLPFCQSDPSATKKLFPSVKNTFVANNVVKYCLLSIQISSYFTQTLFTKNKRYFILNSNWFDHFKILFTHQFHICRFCVTNVTLNIFHKRYANSVFFIWFEIKIKHKRFHLSNV